MRKNKIYTHSLIALDRGSMKKMGIVTLIDQKKERGSSSSKFKGMSFHKVVATNENVYVFWSKTTKEKTELWAQTFDALLGKKEALKKVYEVKNLDERKAKDASVFVLDNKNFSDYVVIGSELPARKDEDISIEFMTMDASLSTGSKLKSKLPIALLNTRSAGGAYQLGEDGDIHIKTFIVSEEGNNVVINGRKKKYAYEMYPMFIHVDVETGQTEKALFQFDDKNIFDFHYDLGPDRIQCYGFFCDMLKDPKGRTTHGIFTGQISLENYEITNLNFTNFDKALLDQLYLKDKTDQTKARTKKQKAKGADEALNNQYTIEFADMLPDGDAVIFCSIMNNYSTTTCNSKGVCVTHYYCNKRNVTGFRLSPEGTIKWASNLNRAITYSGWDIMDVNVIKDEETYYVVYGSVMRDNASAKSGLSKKKGKVARNTLEYAVFNIGNGKYEKVEYEINAKDVKKRDRRWISAAAIYSMDNQFFVMNSKVGMYSSKQKVFYGNIFPMEMEKKKKKK